MVHNINNDPRSFMYYNGQYYVNGTTIELSDKYMTTYRFNGKRPWKYARFDHQVNTADGLSYFFCAIKIDTLSLRDMGLSRDVVNEHATYFLIPAININEAIGRVIKPIFLTQEENDIINNALLDMATKPMSDFQCPGLICAWLMYIIVLIASLIFRQFYIIWIIASFIFFKWRKEARR